MFQNWGGNGQLRGELSARGGVCGSLTGICPGIGERAMFQNWRENGKPRVNRQQEEAFVEVLQEFAGGK